MASLKPHSTSKENTSPRISISHLTSDGLLPTRTYFLPICHHCGECRHLKSHCWYYFTFLYSLYCLLELETLIPSPFYILRNCTLSTQGVAIRDVLLLLNSLVATIVVHISITILGALSTIIID